MWLLALGALTVVVAMLDALVTTLNVTERPAPLARAVLATTRRPLRRLLRGRARAGVGLTQTVAMLGTWTGLLWLGWWAVLLAEPFTLVHDESGSAAGVLDHLYVAGYSVFTLGTGDVVPTTGAAQLAVVIAAATGLALITLEVTYLLGLTGAAQHKRGIARTLNGLGRSPDDVVRHAWNGTDFSQAAHLLDSIASDLVELAEHHAAFPVLHDFAATRRELATGPALLALVDAVHLMHRRTGDHARLPTLPTVMTHAAIDELLTTTPQLEPLGPEPPGPDVTVLRELGVPVVEQDGERARERDRRRGLQALAASEGWPPAPRASSDGRAAA